MLLTLIPALWGSERHFSEIYLKYLLPEYKITSLRRININGFGWSCYTKKSGVRNSVGCRPTNVMNSFQSVPRTLRTPLLWRRPLWSLSWFPALCSCCSWAFCSFSVDANATIMRKKHRKTTRWTLCDLRYRHRIRHRRRIIPVQGWRIKP